LLLTMPLLLTACATGPSAPPMVVCPWVPALELDLPPDALARSFTERMQRWLSGSLETPTAYELPSGNVRLNTMP
jgi:hypothetical protein